MNIHGRTFISWPEIWQKPLFSGHEMNLNRSTAISWPSFSLNPTTANNEGHRSVPLTTIL